MCAFKQIWIDVTVKHITGGLTSPQDQQGGSAGGRRVKKESRNKKRKALMRQFGGGCERLGVSKHPSECMEHNS